ncbi:acetamidase/formamidase [Peptoniphilus sp. ING2-D1G]|nr:acetamidase/formamidase [Peptoniphilus sp. ING2-D1G]
MAHYEIKAEDRQFSFDKEHKPVITVQRGDKITFNTVDCFSCQLESPEDLIGDIDFDQVNPGTGPVYVEGAEPGDVLVVHVDDVEVKDYGISVTYGVGPLKENSEIRTKIIPIDQERQIAKFNDLEIPLHKMIGVIGVAPAGDAIGCGRIGDHGGNMDNRLIQKGATLYFPVNVSGALLQIGDLHGAMGDGELDGAALECSGAATVTVDVIKDFKLERPLIETENRWYTTAARDTYQESLELAMKDMQKLMREPYGWDDTDIDIYLSIDGHVEINQGCDLDSMPISLRVGIPKQKGKNLIK